VTKTILSVFEYFKLFVGFHLQKHSTPWFEKPNRIWEGFPKELGVCGRRKKADWIRSRYAIMKLSH
jgi:hypothetical protein